MIFVNMCQIKSCFLTFNMFLSFILFATVFDILGCEANFFYLFRVLLTIVLIYVQVKINLDFTMKNLFIFFFDQNILFIRTCTYSIYYFFYITSRYTNKIIHLIFLMQESNIFFLNSIGVLGDTN